jgi:hypothetical protein
MIQTRETSLHNPSYGRPPKRKKAKKRNHRPRGSRSNPGPFVLTLGALGANPKRRKTVAKKRKKKSTRAPAKANRSKKRNYKSKKRNPGVTMALIKRVMKGKRKKGKSRRNPSIFGMSSRDAFGNSLAVLGSVTGAKLLPPMLPASWSATNLGRFLTTLGVAAGEVAVAHFFFPKYRTMVLAGAGAQTLSIALNPILQKVSANITLGRIRQRAMGATGDFVPGNFPEPHNPIYNRMLMAGMSVTPGAVGPGASVGRYKGRFGGR